MVIKPISPLLKFFLCLFLSFVLFSHGYGAPDWNPYYFDSQTEMSKEGQMRILHKFNEKSELLRCIENHRLAIFEANPKTIVDPHHMDADSVLVITKGKGTITFVLQGNSEFFNLGLGDVIKVPAGTTFYITNDDDTEKLQMAMLIQPVNTPGQDRTTRYQLDRLFHQQTQRKIIRPTKQEFKPLSQHDSSARGHSDMGPFNLLNQQPVYSNRFGQFFQASPNDYKQLQDLDVSVSFAHMKQCSKNLPYYNTRATTIALVVEGSGHVELASPHLSRGKHQRISTSLSPGDVFAIPPGHPFAIVASENENLSIIGFDINAKNNQINFQAGQDDNILKEMDREAKELTLDVPAEFVWNILHRQRESPYVACRPQQGQQEGYSLASTVDFVGENPQQKYRQCLQRCQRQEQGRQQQQECQKRCEEQLIEQERDETHVDQELLQCLQQCKQQILEGQEKCLQQCEEYYGIRI